MKKWAVLISATALVAACAPEKRVAPPTPPLPVVEPTPDSIAGTMGSSPPATESNFYAAYKTITHDGIPGVADRAKLAPYLTKELDLLLVRASAAEATRAAAGRFKGDPFTAKRAGAAAIDLGQSCNWGGGFGENSEGGECYPILSNADEVWKDKLLVVDISGSGWLVDDVAYDSTMPGDNQGKLTELLTRLIGG